MFLYPPFSELRRAKVVNRQWVAADVVRQTCQQSGHQTRQQCLTSNFATQNLVLRCRLVSSTTWANAWLQGIDALLYDRELKSDTFHREDMGNRGGDVGRHSRGGKGRDVGNVIIREYR